ncbi:MAG: hypothetical protein OHK0038_16080 [Flammeovirgaceae bacterium]
MKSIEIIWRIILIISTLYLFSCKKQLNIDMSSAATYEVDKLRYEYMQLKSKLNYSNGENEIKALADIRLKKDSMIWFSIRHGTGIEGVRGVITKDSVLIINRLDKVYYEFDYPKLYQKLNFEFSFEMLQAAIIGEANLKPENTSQAIKEGGNFVVNSSLDLFDIKVYISALYRKMTHALVKDRRTNTLLEIDYSEFREAQKDKIEDKPNQLFAHLVQAVLSYKKDEQPQKIIIGLEHSKVEIMEKPIRFPFKMSEKFEKVDK